MKKLMIFGILNFLMLSSNAQTEVIIETHEIAINANGNSAESSAILDIQSTTKGMLIPKMTTSQRTSISNPADGLMVYDIDTDSFWFYDDTSWSQVGNDNLGNHVATQPINMGLKKILNLGFPTGNNDAARKGYVDNHNDADADITNELVTAFTLVDTNLTITEGGIAHTISLSQIGGGAMENESGVVRNSGDHATDDFVFGESELPGVFQEDNELFFFDKSSAAFRTGILNNSLDWAPTRLGIGSFASGENTEASGDYSIALGLETRATGLTSIAQGYLSTASGDYSFAMGRGSNASAIYSTALGWVTSASGANSMAVNEFTKSIGTSSFAAGNRSEAQGNSSFAAGDRTTASGFAATTFGNNSIASGNNSLAAGSSSEASGLGSFAMGNDCDAIGNNSISIGNSNEATGIASIAIGSSCDAIEDYTFAAGFLSVATARHSVALGRQTSTTGDYSMAVNRANVASEIYSFASGNSTKANGNASFSGGWSTEANASYSTVFGRQSKANGSASFATGNRSIANTKYSLALGDSIITNGYASFAIGSYNDTLVSKQLTLNNSTPLLSVGNGHSSSGRSNAFVVRYSGDIEVDQDILPMTDDNSDLGSSSLRFDDVYATNGVIQTSDIRAKKNIVDSPYGLEEILQLNPMIYHWNSETESDKKHVGLIAQELLEIIPELVNEPDKEEDLLGVKYAEITPVLIQAIKELHAENQSLKKQNTDQSDRLTQLESNVDEIKELLKMTAFK